MSYALTLAGISFANALAIVSPGPAFVLVTRPAASRSRAIGVATGLGVAGATISWAVAATFGWRRSWRALRHSTARYSLPAART